MSSSKRQDILIVGLCLGILGLVYVFGLLIYLKVRRSKTYVAPDDTEHRISSDSHSDQRLERSSGVYPVGDEEKTEIQTPNGNGLKHSTDRFKLFAEGQRYQQETYQKEQDSETLRTLKSTNGEKIILHSHRAMTRFHLNPEYFEPEMLASPPGVVLEFLYRLRESVAYARRRFRIHRYRPSLSMIPEDDYFYQDARIVEEIRTLSNMECLPSKEIPNLNSSENNCGVSELYLCPPKPPPRRFRGRKKKMLTSCAEVPNDLSSPSDIKCSPLTNNSCESKNEEDNLNEECQPLSKFDMFRLDLYDKIRQMKHPHSTCNHDNLEILEAKDDQLENDDFSVDSDSNDEKQRQTEMHEDGNVNCQIEQISGSSSGSKISRRKLLNKLQISRTQDSCSNNSHKDLIQSDSVNQNQMEQDDNSNGIQSDDEMIRLNKLSSPSKTSSDSQSLNSSSNSLNHGHTVNGEFSTCKCGLSRSLLFPHLQGLLFLGTDSLPIMNFPSQQTGRIDYKTKNGIHSQIENGKHTRHQESSAMSVCTVSSPKRKLLAKPSPLTLCKSSSEISDPSDTDFTETEESLELDSLHDTFDSSDDDNYATYDGETTGRGLHRSSSICSTTTVSSDMTEDSLDAGHSLNKIPLSELTEDLIELWVSRVATAALPVENGRVTRGMKSLEIAETFKTFSWKHICQKNNAEENESNLNADIIVDHKAKIKNNNLTSKQNLNFDKLGLKESLLSTKIEENIQFDYEANINEDDIDIKKSMTKSLTDSHNQVVINGCVLGSTKLSKNNVFGNGLQNSHQKLPTISENEQSEGTFITLITVDSGEC